MSLIFVSRPRRPSAFGLALAFGAAPLAAEAQEKTEERTDIVVLGMRRTVDRTLSSDPATERMSQSSRSLERDVLEAAGTYRLSDTLELVSGFSQQNNRGGVLDNFAIRGFTGTPDGGAEFYVDGFVANRGMAPPRDPATVERIEVLKGPAGAVFGDVDPGGRGEGRGGGARRAVAALPAGGGQPVRRALRGQFVQPAVDLSRRAPHRPRLATARHLTVASAEMM